MYRFCRTEAAGLVAEFRIEVKITYDFISERFQAFSINTICACLISILRRLYLLCSAFKMTPGAEEAKIILN